MLINNLAAYFQASRGIQTSKYIITILHYQNYPSGRDLTIRRNYSPLYWSFVCPCLSKLTLFIFGNNTLVSQWTLLLQHETKNKDNQSCISISKVWNREEEAQQECGFELNWKAGTQMQMYWPSNSVLVIWLALTFWLVHCSNLVLASLCLIKSPGGG